MLLCPDGQRPALGQGSLPAECSSKPSLDVLPLRAGGQQGSHLSASWPAVEISLSAVLFSGDLGCAVVLLDTQVSGAGPGGLQLRDGFCLVSFLRSRKSTPCWVEPVKPAAGSQMNRGSEGPEIGGRGARASSSAHWSPGRQRNGEAEGSEEVYQAMGTDLCLVRNERQEVSVQETKAEGSRGQGVPLASIPAPGFWGPRPGQVMRQPSKESSLDPPGPGELMR